MIFWKLCQVDLKKMEFIFLWNMKYFKRDLRQVRGERKIVIE